MVGPAAAVSIDGSARDAPGACPSAAPATNSASVDSENEASENEASENEASENEASENEAVCLTFMTNPMGAAGTPPVFVG